MRKWPIVVLSVLGCGILHSYPTALFSSAHAATATKKPYTVVNGRGDGHIINGWLRYGESCMRCHGEDGAGSSYAPDLTQALKNLTHDQVLEIIINGKQDVSNSQDLVMPAFGTNPDVVNNIEDIYAYLKARSDGALGRGRPKRIPGK
ncbi:MAG TPA: cytochrome c [Acetobacteraceae bacterium]|nr:cytochrome c [Acetobacteraceae bacterium]